VIKLCIMGTLIPPLLVLLTWDIRAKRREEGGHAELEHPLLHDFDIYPDL
jgi:hypothetical protein